MPRPISRPLSRQFIVRLVFTLFLGGFAMSVHAATPALELTSRFITAFEGRDLETITPLLSKDVSLEHTMTFSGSVTPDFAPQGKEAVLAYFQQVFATMGRIRFETTRLSETRDGSSVYYEAVGDFTTAAGAPYNNVYLFRLDFEAGKVAHIAEYANPVIFSQTFGPPPAP